MSDDKLFQYLDEILMALTDGQIERTTSLLEPIKQRYSDPSETEGNQNVRIFFLLILADFEQLLEDRRKEADLAAGSVLGPGEEVPTSSIEKLLMKALQAVKVTYGEGHSAMGDIMTCIMSSRVRAGQFAEALEWGGQALVNRIANFGYVHSKTADAHYNLGILYRLNFDFKESLKELKLCRSIRMTISSETSLSVADTDYSIGMTEKLLGEHVDSYFSVYKCLKVRCNLLGGDHADSIQAYEVLMKQREVLDRNSVVLGAEVKDRLQSLRKGPRAGGPKNEICLVLDERYGAVEDSIPLSYPDIRKTILAATTGKIDTGMRIDSSTIDLFVGALTKDPISWMRDVQWHANTKLVKEKTKLPYENESKPSSTPSSKTNTKQVSYGEDNVREFSRVIDVSKLAANIRKASESSPKITEVVVGQRESTKVENFEAPYTLSPVGASRVTIKNSSRRGPSRKRFDSDDSDISKIDAIGAVNIRPFSVHKNSVKESQDGILEPVGVQRALMKSNIRRAPSQKKFENPVDMPSMLESITVPGIQTYLTISDSDATSTSAEVEKTNIATVRKKSIKSSCADIETMRTEIGVKQGELVSNENAIKMVELEMKQRVETVKKCEFELSELEQRIYTKKLEVEREVFEIDDEIVKMRKLIMGISKKDVSDIWLSSIRPADSLRLTLEMICISIGERPQPLAWEAIKRVLRKDDFLSRVANIPPSFPPTIATKIREQYLRNKEMSASKVEKVSKFCAILRQWIVLLFSRIVAVEKLIPHQEVISLLQSEAKICSQNLRVAKDIYLVADGKLNLLKSEQLSLKREIASLTQSIISIPGGDEILLQLQSSVSGFTNKGIDVASSSFSGGRLSSNQQDDVQRNEVQQIGSKSSKTSSSLEQEIPSVGFVSVSTVASRSPIAQIKFDDEKISRGLTSTEKSIRESSEVLLLAQEQASVQSSVQSSALLTNMQAEQKMKPPASSSFSSEIGQVRGPNTKLGFPRLNPKRNNSVLIRDDENNCMILVKRATGADIYPLIEKKVIALGVVAHFLKENAQISGGGAVFSASNAESSTDHQLTNKGLRKIPKPPPLPDTWPPSFIYGKADSSNPSRASGASPIAAALAFGSSSASTGPKTKQIYWEPITDVASTLWADDVSSICPSPEEIFGDIKDVFSAVSVPLKSAKVATKAIGPKSSKMLLDPQRSQSIAIMLAKFGKSTPQDIAKAISDFKLSALGVGELNSLRNFVPLKEETERINEHVKEMELSGAVKLNLVESYIHAMSTVSNLELRLDSFLLANSYEDTTSNIKKKCSTLINVAGQITGSVRLKCILHVCLSGGNLLNNGSKQVAVAPGFKISSFSKMLQTKSKSGGSFLDYVIEKLLTTSPDMLTVKDDCSDIDEARMINIVAIAGDIRALEANLNTLGRIKDEETNPEVASKMKDLHSNISKAVEKTKKLYNEACEDFGNLCGYIGEPKESASVEAVISLLSSIINTIDAAVIAASPKDTPKRRLAVAMTHS